MFTKRIVLVGLLFFCDVYACSHAAPKKAVSIHQNRPTPKRYPLWSDAILAKHPTTIRHYVELRHGDKNDKRLFFVTKPEVSAYVPGKTKRWPCILILPGGGFQHVAIDKEGHDIARWLYHHDIASLVLEYRMPQRNEREFLPDLPLRDVKHAFEMMASHADTWGLDKTQLGVMGFSAGGYLAASLSNLPNEEFRPAFQILVYPFTAPFRPDTEAIHKANERLFGEGFSEETLLKYSPEKHISSSTPPSFIVHARNDEKVPVEHAVALYNELSKASVPVEMHLYEKGGHGFGMKSLQGSLRAWPTQLLAWLQGNAFHRPGN